MIPLNGKFVFISTDTNGYPADVPDDATHFVCLCLSNPNDKSVPLSYNNGTTTVIAIVPTGEFVNILPFMRKDITDGFVGDAVGGLLPCQNLLVSFYKFSF